MTLNLPSPYINNRVSHGLLSLKEYSMLMIFRFLYNDFAGKQAWPYLWFSCHNSAWAASYSVWPAFWPWPREHQWILWSGLVCIRNYITIIALQSVMLYKTTVSVTGAALPLFGGAAFYGHTLRARLNLVIWKGFFRADYREPSSHISIVPIY